MTDDYIVSQVFFKNSQNNLLHILVALHRSQINADFKTQVSAYVVSADFLNSKPRWRKEQHFFPILFEQELSSVF